MKNPFKHVIWLLQKYGNLLSKNEKPLFVLKLITVAWNATVFCEVQREKVRYPNGK
jgi:hypothetical protein